MITPSSLVANWRKEFKKWIGDERLRVFDVNNKSRTINEFLKTVNSGTHYPVLIISYDTYLTCAEALKNVKFDLLICDEGHRLKNPKSKTYVAITDNIATSRKILLTGTPVQNNLEELYALANFVNPNVFGNYSRFKRKFEDPINAAQEKHCPKDVKQAGADASDKLQDILNKFTIRRTMDMLAKFLPPKSELVAKFCDLIVVQLTAEYVICCELTETQRTMYVNSLESNIVNKLILGVQNDYGCLFSILSTLRKLCNHPSLALTYESGEQVDEESKKVCCVSSSQLLIQLQLLEGLNLRVDEDDFQVSTKMIVVGNMLAQLAKHKKEKVVIVSNFTKTLDLIQKFCDKHRYKYTRLDGSTTTTKRQEIVDAFNQPTSPTCNACGVPFTLILTFILLTLVVFLLSTKAGGVGLNLIGASRLIMFDLDWNPAHDLQAMARIWRDGQKKEVHIYRLLASGTIEEKIFQRQIKKDGLSGAVMDSDCGMKFSTEDLKDLFTFTDCNSSTHAMIGCKCDNPDAALEPSQKKIKGEDSATQKFTLAGLDNELKVDKKKGMAQLQDWGHFHKDNFDGLSDEIFAPALNVISFVFRNRLNPNESE